MIPHVLVCSIFFDHLQEKERLPGAKPRMIHSSGDPYSILLLVKHGIDLIVSAFSKSAGDLGI